MRTSLILVTFAMSALLQSVCCAADNDQPAIKPGPAYVGVRIALARSGPGTSHYTTDALTSGDMVQVLEVENGWAAIEPPVNAFSWIAADKLVWLGDEAAEVRGDNVKAWLGSELEDVAKHVSQIQLRRGERVRVLEKKEAGSQSSSEKWVKIQPPAGERRWVRVNELRDSPPLESRTRQAAEQRSSRDRPAAEDGWIDRRNKAGSSSILSDAIEQQRAGHHPSRSSMITARDRLHNFNDQIARLQLEMTRAAASTDRGQLARLRSDIEDLVDAGRTPVERGEANRLLESADELLELAEQREELGLQPAADRPVKMADDDERPLQRFIVKGWLMPVAWYGRPTELCAIMNDEHSPVAFVTPAPGVNLRRYVNKEVGIIGEDSLNKIKDMRHVVAHRVVEMDRHRDVSPDTFAKAPWVRFRQKPATSGLEQLMKDEGSLRQSRID